MTSKAKAIDWDDYQKLSDGTRWNAYQKQLREIERLRGMMLPLVFANPLSSVWGIAMDDVGYYVTEELGVTEDAWKKATNPTEET